MLGLDAENNFASGIHPEVLFRYGEESSVRTSEDVLIGVVADRL